MYSRPLPSEKTEKGCLWGRGRLYTGFSQTDDPFSSFSVKTANDQIPVSSVFNDAERTVQNDCLP